MAEQRGRKKRPKAERKGDALQKLPDSAFTLQREPERQLTLEKMRLLNKPALGLMLFLLGAHTGARAGEPAEQPPVSAEHALVLAEQPEDEDSIDEETLSEMSIETQAQSIELMQQAFARTADQRNDPDLLADVSQEELDRVVEMVSAYPVDDVIQAFTDLSGVSKEELIADNHLMMVALYSPTWLEEHNEEIAQLEGYDIVSENVLKHWSRSSGFITPGGEFLGINVKHLHEALLESQFDQGSFELITHEFAHTFSNDSVYEDPDVEDRFTYLDVLVSEGITQAFVIEASKRVRPDEPLLDTIYQTGEKHAGYLVMEVLGRDVVFNAYATDNYSAIPNAWNEIYGEGSWERAMRFSVGEKDDEISQHLFPLFGLMLEMGQDAQDTYLRVNAKAHHGRILPLFAEDGLVEALYIRDDRMSRTITAGLARLRIPHADGSETIYVVPVIDPDETVYERVQYRGRDMAVTPMPTTMVSLYAIGASTDAKVLERLRERLDRMISNLQVEEGGTKNPDDDAQTIGAGEPGQTS
ncbi:MAG: hypothetical protein ABIG66_00600 [Candidatus Kerfeldbacteria bacterium]